MLYNVSLLSRQLVIFEVHGLPFFWEMAQVFFPGLFLLQCTIYCGLEKAHSTFANSQTAGKEKVKKNLSAAVSHMYFHVFGGQLLLFFV